MILSKAAWHIVGEEPPDTERRLELARDLVRWRAHRKRHPITTCSARERPRLRGTIIQYNLRPYPALDAWNGYSAWYEDHETFLSMGLIYQMRRMIVEGYFDAKD